MSTILPAATLAKGQLHFADQDGFDRMRQHGAFYLRYPEGMDFRAGIELAQKYYLDCLGQSDDAYRGFRSRDLVKSLLGYSQTGGDQDELLQIELPLWGEYLPGQVTTLLGSLNELSRTVLLDLFRRTGIDAAHIDTISSGLSNNQSLQYCIFNHYRSAVQHPIGLTAHKDSGFITTLYTTEPGLESLEEGEWVPFDPLAGHFTVVIGHAFEVLTEQLSKAMRASYHRVRGMAPRTAEQPERFTFGVYIGPAWTQDLYQCDVDGQPVAKMSFLDFQKRKAAEMNYEFHPKVHAAVT
ncbi:2OG-Fe(II) oxygenase family protein [Janthinobacterium sp. PAMC25594]|uniref:2OG-Fe(II) oxygenase family protein n=1 Tax=Janthinobacterium sp. PAMC25594 TaxID=2861284 RepID=UPI001C62EED4|nr:2OG-Fe(II) oxygenase family protein [Janthinobacterium sp. PAMC25594]QYG08885.1 hypothetical protein KY494_09140 [Janthinobacterium sp. PAMC25594]